MVLSRSETSEDDHVMSAASVGRREAFQTYIPKRHQHPPDVAPH